MRRGLPGAQTPFFLSYAHTGFESDKLAERFYEELCRDLQTLVAPPVGARIGFFDQGGMEPSLRWDEELATALGTCQVLVALLSVPYLRSEWCGREWHAFTMRERESIPNASGSPPLGHIIPVRWSPIPFKLPAVVDQVDFFTPKATPAEPDLTQEYETEGIFRLLHTGDDKAFGEIVWQLAKAIQQTYYGQRLRPKRFISVDLRNVFEADQAERDSVADARSKRQSYADGYQAVVNRLAAQVIWAAESDPTAPVEQKKLEAGTRAYLFPPNRSRPIFNIEVAAPTSANAPASSDPKAYGETPEEWHPFPGQELAPAEYARQLIQRFDFDARISELSVAVDPAGRRPGIIVIDPAFAAHETGRAALRAVASTLPRWVLPLVVVAPDDPATRELADDVVDVLSKAKQPSAELPGRAARDVKSLAEFAAAVPSLVAEAEREYLRYRSRRVSSPRPTRRPQLGGIEASVEGAEGSSAAPGA